MTVLEAIDKSRAFLESKGIESARLESEWLLGHALNLKRLQLYLAFERVLTPAEIDLLRELVKRRGAREPLQHVLGTAVFCGMDIEVNREVLIPRPETELLAEFSWSFLRTLAAPSKFLDFGTGSGCLAIAICQNAPLAGATALDLSAAALDVARRNAVRHALSGRISFLQSDRFADLEPSQYDLIISNPPYIPAEEIPTLQPEVRDHDPRAALDGGPDGLDFYRYLAGEAPAFLKPKGKIMLEYGDGQSEAIAELFSSRGWTAIEIRNDLSPRPRFLIADRPAV